MTTRRSKTNYINGDRVDIINGKYKGMSATYLGKYGNVMCSVALLGGELHRNVWLSSVKPHQNQDKRTETEKKTGDASHWAKKKRNDINKLRQSMEDMKLQLDLMISALDSLSIFDDEDDR